MKHKFDRKKYDDKKTEVKSVISSLKDDKSKKTTVSSLADRIILIEKALGI